MSSVTSAFTMVAEQSWRIGLLIFALALLRWAGRGRIPQQIFFASWIIVAVALLVPVKVPLVWGPSIAASLNIAPAREGNPASPRSATQAASGFSSLVSSAETLTIPPGGARFHYWTRSSLVAAVWLLGVAILTTLRAGAWYRFHRRLGRSLAPVSPKFEAAVAECADQLRIRRSVSVFVTDAAGGPAMGGLWNPYLLMPASLEEGLSAKELRLVILHELGHWRRRDTAANLLVQCALNLHWFNPAAWLFASMARLDCELACDEFVLARAADAGACAYGTTILKVLATVRRRKASPPLLGILGGKQQLKRRIDMIARFRNVSALRTAAGYGLVALVAIIAVTGKTKASATDSAQPDPIAAKVQANAVELKHYVSQEWGFAMDVPKSWNAFPPVSANSPFEVVRFLSRENGNHDVIIFRQPRDPKETLAHWSDQVQRVLAKGGFGNFATGKTTIGSQDVMTLDFDRATPDGGTWSCRHYFITDGTLGYVLGFGTTKRSEMFELYDRMAKSFQISN
jgi:beta-lactamase regulating signal transducer with metallopeptidase domain